MNLYNVPLMISNYPAYRKFNSDIKNYMSEQEKYLLDCVRANEATLFGMKHNFNRIDSVETFKNNVPLTDYSYHEPYINLDMMENKNALVNEKILLFEPSSGSTSASKFIPYTKGLKDDFMAGVQPWLFDLYKNHKSVLRGKSYWSISPINETKSRTQSGIPIGFEDDTGYFNKVQSWLFSKVFVVPAEVKFIKDIDDFRYVTLLFLIGHRKLSLISVWNPTFLTLLLECFKENADSLINDIENGTINPPKGTKLPEVLYEKSKSDKVRAGELLDIVGQKKDYLKKYECGIFSEIWPYLKVISCWDQGNSKKSAKQLEKHFKDITINSKGLLATEGLVTFPLESTGHIVSYKSHFFEFVEIRGEEEKTDENDTRLLSQLEKGAKYSVVMTTRGGLYRYRLHDIVRVTGHYKGVPLLEFIGKEENISDFYGEKLHEHHVSEILNNIGIESDFYFVAPNIINDTFFYSLYIKESDSILLDVYKEKIEEGLIENFHYKYARHLGQIKPLKVYVMTGNSEKEYYDYYQDQLEVKLGDIKYLLLSKIPNLHEHIEGYFVD